jgi:hypothetical protein
MVTNVGTLDRIFRVIIGLALLTFALELVYPNTGWNWAGWLGIVPILTALYGYCPVYALLHIDSCESGLG